MKVVVITGSTRGIGFGLADSFLEMGCSVVISGRTRAGVESATTVLQDRHETELILGWACDVAEPAQVQDLWTKSIKRFERVDIWINNAGIASPLREFWEVAPEETSSVVATNLLGSMFGARVAIQGMLSQGYGALYNMEGMGSTGRKREGMTAYGTTKAAIRYFTDALILETQNTPIVVGSLSPGMVPTDLVIEQFAGQPELWQQSKRALGVIMDDVATVTPWLARKVLENDKHGARIAWLTRRKLAGRFVSAPFSRGRELGDLEEYRGSASGLPRD
ncbi:MAG: SDR family oxidoreductase [Chloroflexota bacterium]|nr:MAG: SDR family oxidoreductase [Chloroflexota bacterium]